MVVRLEFEAKQTGNRSRPAPVPERSPGEAGRRGDGPHFREILRRADQAGVAVLLLLALLAMAGYWLAHGGWHGELIEIERAAPLEAPFRVDINRADWPEFAQLPEVGETLARRIVATRVQHGPFQDHHHLLKVHGIGPNTLVQIKPYLLPLPESATAGGAEGAKTGDKTSGHQ